MIKVTGLEPESYYQVFATVDPKVAGIIIEVPSDTSRVHASRRVFQLLFNTKSMLPVIHSLVLSPKDKDDLILRAGSEAGALLVDGLGDGILMSADTFELDYIRSTSFNLLQGSRMRSTKTDFVSCPSCGRTLFDLQEVTEQIKQKTGHLPGVAIAIMGCIVNGPGTELITII
jgi:(E)-4-hydroxy-3-methylbut-2-enyl-diphosphate synthase